MTEIAPIPVIDIFAGPGGLAEGFASLKSHYGTNTYDIALSIEMDTHAHETLSLRAFFHSFPHGAAPVDYYSHLRGEISRQELFHRFPTAAAHALNRAWRAELGKVDNSLVDNRIRGALGSRQMWVLCGGPPCQAFSVVGRSRTGGIRDEDERVYLYLQYLRILAVHRPPVFVMENVKGLLSSRVNGGDHFAKILDDLRNPGKVLSVKDNPRDGYTLYSLVTGAADQPGSRRQTRDFIVKAEDFGIPQSRHRVIVVGVRNDFAESSIPRLTHCTSMVPLNSVLDGLPQLRSGLSRHEDGQSQWKSAIEEVANYSFMRSVRSEHERHIRRTILGALAHSSHFPSGRGGEFVRCQASIRYRPDWFLDPRLKGVCNHTSRPHMVPDLHRYLYSTAYAKTYGRSPEIRDFPPELYPKHKNIAKALATGHFEDRFRVQMADRPCTTITSHLARDGHYFIHYDETQCRSLTVREAARVQTFPDNYFFCGPRTQQYRQVGNAVPPMLARAIAEVIWSVLTKRDPSVIASM